MPDSLPTIPGATLILGPVASAFGTQGYLAFTFAAPAVPPAAPPAGYEVWGTGKVSDGSALYIVRPAKVVQATTPPPSPPVVSKPPAPPPATPAPTPAPAQPVVNSTPAPTPAPPAPLPPAPPAAPPPVLTPPPPAPPQIIVVDPTVIQVKAGDDLKAALAQMANGKQLQLQRGGNWQGTIIPWAWSSANVTAFGDGPDPIFGGILLKSAVVDVAFKGLALKGNPGIGYGIDWRAAQTQRVKFDGITVTGFASCISAHVPALEAAPPEQWHKDISFTAFRVQGARAARPADSEDHDGQGMYLANIDGLTIDGGHADDCGGMDPCNIFRHGWYLSAMLRNYRISNCAATRCSAFGIQARSDGGVIENCAAYDTGGGIMFNGATGTVRNNVVVLGHGHSAGIWGKYGKGGFTFNMGSGDVRGNLVVNGPTPLPVGWYQPPPLNVGYRETKPAGNQAWEWTKKDAKGSVRPLIKIDPVSNVDRTDRVCTIDVASLLVLPPEQVSAAIRSAAMAAAGMK